MIFANKNIQVIGTQKTIGQAKIAGGIIENIINENPTTTLDKVAIVLGEENLWFRFYIRCLPLLVL
jgi:tRNA A37 threonylcarbamoyladenosine dehydratase